jgi:hypothetical protein
MRKTFFGIVLIYSVIALAEVAAPSQKETELKSDKSKNARLAPKAGPGERQLTCDEIDKLELIPKVSPSAVKGSISSSVSDSIDKVNRSIQYKKDFCAGKIKTQPQ